MDTDETQRKIHESDEFVLSEVHKLKILYGLKKEIRYDQERIHESHTESVAEHIYALHCLIDYFLPLENPEGDWDTLKIHQMAQYHDIDEIETGDIVGYKKTTEDYMNEKNAREIVISKIPESMRNHVRELATEFDDQDTVEAKFVKAIDKLESSFQMFSDDGKNWQQGAKHTKQLHQKFKGSYIKLFPILERFDGVLSNIFEKEGFYYKEN